MADNDDGYFFKRQPMVHHHHHNQYLLHTAIFLIILFTIYFNDFCCNDTLKINSNFDFLEHYYFKQEITTIDNDYFIQFLSKCKNNKLFFQKRSIFFWSVKIVCTMKVFDSSLLV